MRYISSLFIALGLLAGQAELADERTEAVNVRIQELLPWIAGETGYKTDYVKPIVVFKEPLAINLLVYGEKYQKGQVRDAIAATLGTTIILPTTFELGKNDDVLIHEVVHVLQNENDHMIGDQPGDFKCRNLMEYEAYQVQEKFIDEFGIGEKLHPIFMMYFSHCPNPYGLS